MIAVVTDPSITLAVAPVVWILGGLFAINAIGALSTNRRRKGHLGALQFAPDTPILRDDGTPAADAEVRLLLHEPGQHPRVIVATRTDSVGMVSLRVSAGVLPAETLFNPRVSEGYQPKPGVYVMCSSDGLSETRMKNVDLSKYPWLELWVWEAGDVAWSSAHGGRVYGGCPKGAGGSMGPRRIVMALDYRGLDSAAKSGDVVEGPFASLVGDYNRSRHTLQEKVLMKNDDVVFAPQFYAIDPIHSIPEEDYFEIYEGGKAAQRWFIDPQLRAVIRDRREAWGGFADDTPRAIDVMLAMMAEQGETRPIFDSVYWGMIGNVDEQAWRNLARIRPGFAEFVRNHLDEFMTLFHEHPGEFEESMPFGTGTKA